MRKQEKDRLKNLGNAADRRAAHDKHVAVELGYKNARKAYLDMGKDFLTAVRSHNDFTGSSINKVMA